MESRFLLKVAFGPLFPTTVSYIKPIPTQETLVVGKSGPNATFTLVFFLVLGWPWVGEFVGFIIISIRFPTQPNLVNHKQHPINSENCRIVFVFFYSLGKVPHKVFRHTDVADA